MQKSSRTLVRRSSFKPLKSLTRLSSTKFRRSLMRKSSGGPEMKRKLKKSRSIKAGNRSSIVLPNDADMSSNQLKERSYCDVKNAHFQASSCHFESSLSSNGRSKRSLSNLKPSLAPGNKSMRVITRTSSLRPLRILTKMNSRRTKRPSMKKRSQMLDSSIQKATCSSVLKDSKFPDRLELLPGGSESEGISAMKVCTYSYCSLHGHRHPALPPLKRFVSMRRRQLKTQRSIKLESQSFHRAKRSSKTKKGMRARKMDCHTDAAVPETAHKNRAIRKMAAPKADLNGESIHGGDDEDTNNSESDGENMLEEVSHPHLCLKEKQQLSEFSTAESKVYCTDKKEEGITASNSLTVDHPEHTNIILQNVEDPGPFDDIACTCHEEIPVGGKVHQDVNEGRISSLKFDIYKGDSELNTSGPTASTSLAKEPVDKSRSLATDVFVESRAINDMISSASICEQLGEQTAQIEERNEDSLQDNQFPVTDSEPDCNSWVVEKTQREKQKHVGLWNLIYQHMVSGIASDDEMLPPLDKMDKKEQGEDANTLPAMNDSDSCSHFSGIDQGMEVYDHDRGSHKIQLYQRNAIKLVQEAFDKILSEIPDHSSDDQSINNDSISDKGENIHSASGEIRMSTSFDSGKESIVQDQEEMGLKEYNINEPEGGKTQSNIGSKSNQQAPKSWSNLKKIIILKRFVKALEKVRNFNPQKPRHLPVQLEPEAEKIHLRHQTMEDRKNSEEWMLDYALQQVISTLAPAQKRKVALLVQAFETLVPLPETATSPRSNVDASSHATPVQTFTTSSHETGSGKGKETKFGISLCKTSRPKEEQDQVSDSCTAEEDVPESCSELNEPSSESGSTHTAPTILTSEFTSIGLKQKGADLNHGNGDQNSIAKDDDPASINYCLVELREALDKPSKSADVATSSYDEVSLNGEVLQEVPKEVSLLSASEVQDRDFEFNSETLESDCRIIVTGERSDEPKSQIPKNFEGSIADYNAHTPVSVSKLQEESSKAAEGQTVLQNKFFQQFTPHEESKFSSADLAQEKQVEKQKNMRLWYLIYKHMVSGSASLLEKEPDKEEQADDANTSYGMNNDCSYEGFSQDTDMENHNAGSHKIELQQIEAIRMVEEAIDEILVPGIQDDSPNDHSVSSDVILDQEHLEKQPDKGGVFYISTYIGCPKESYGESNSTKVEQSSMLDPKEPCLNSENGATAEKEKAVFKEGNKPKPPAQKSWCNLKKLILLKRFIKALEKVEKINLREPRFLPLDPEKEAEKVHLRHQDMEDKKNADEWMLDYALQQVVAKLTPARKRKVQLLVEAFETVSPTIGS
ncbi:calmodulin binding protein PICBP isoform X1 [Hevea brasiliensis]|uniref:calmodulin binding protein PICBP isoform X1 n=1 Tax=Hevea brasiliensis TaxID=3981 RepID=UPI0025FDB379|nr:calmodulin binding protein PICBP isoform X1 [Hevea brasiliensis]